MSLHLCNKVTHCNEDGTLALKWCVKDETGKRLTRWMTYNGAQQQLGKIQVQIRRASW